MTLAPFVRIVARGAGRARALTLDEARDAMALILNGKAAPEAIGALLMVLRLRGETPEEIAGFTAALRAHVSGAIPAADLDWPSYAAGRSRGAPLFLLSARLVAQAGYRVSLHGWNSHQSAAASVRAALDLAGPDVGYAPLETLCPAAFDMLGLRDTFGLRSCINTVLRMWNPSGAPVSVQGVFHPSYRGLQARAAERLGQRNLAIIKGGGGEFERHPSKDICVFGLRDGAHIQTPAPAATNNTRRLHETGHAIDLSALWHGHLNDAFAIATVTGTAGLALYALKAAPTVEKADKLARALWEARHQPESRTA
ncbi:glycosyl transferase family protein [Pseudooctadecabacter jejudonensis]|uniref:Anthranilate phosphoribosyltransferase n=1 Tax=Pseudooctadecabacter jejudonensis TaxID=1391910 RepID=A0A1Y5S2C8_9RHOB|nr:glycosyl transferase family protein [Pseudooctadecabacter jejudonensis]SLN28387.1 Anthranilate phosphoribosyltransferase [Pseudooctadecabacter jejudonensis]